MIFDLVIQAHVDRMLYVGNKTVPDRAPAFKITLEIHIRDVDRNVLWTPTARPTALVYNQSALIPVLVFVAKTLNARL